MNLPLTAKPQGVTTIDYQIPALMTLDWIPSFGKSALSTDPASVAGKEIYGRVRAAYSGALDADAPDFMIYLGALDSVFSYIGYLKRMYRCLTTYTPENIALPDILLQGMGLSNEAAVQLRKDKVRFWQGINQLILLSRKFKCPAVMDIFNRHYWMSDNVYADAATLRAQLYMFTLAGVYSIAEGAESASGEPTAILQMKPVPRNFVLIEGQNHSVCDSLLDFGTELINALDAWDDCYTISGYLQRAYDGVQSFAVAELLQDELMAAQFVPEVLSQIENSKTVLPSAVDDSYYDTLFSSVQVTQNVLLNAVVTSTALEMPVENRIYEIDASISAYNTAFSGAMSPMLSLRSDAPTVADSVIASRLLAVPQWSTTTKDTKTVYVFDYIAGTEVPLMWRLYRAPDQQDAAVSAVTLPAVSFNGAVKLPINPQPIELNSIKPTDIAYLAQFDWHPIILVCQIQNFGTIGAQQNAVPMGDIHNPTSITADMLTNLNTVCLYSEFNSFGL